LRGIFVPLQQGEDRQVIELGEGSSGMGRVVLIAITALILVLGLSGVALAATPQDIFDDWLDNGQLDGKYTDAELQAYLDDALIDQYNDPDTVAELDAAVTRLLRHGGSDFPMTGAQLALIGVGALALVGVGFGLRRLARSRP
jgi:hypothetical protein